MKVFYVMNYNKYSKAWEYLTSYGFFSADKTRAKVYRDYDIAKLSYVIQAKSKGVGNVRIMEGIR